MSNLAEFVFDSPEAEYIIKEEKGRVSDEACSSIPIHQSYLAVLTEEASTSKTANLQVCESAINAMEAVYIVEEEIKMEIDSDTSSINDPLLIPKEESYEEASDGCVTGMSCYVKEEMKSLKQTTYEVKNEESAAEEIVCMQIKNEETYPISRYTPSDTFVKMEVPDIDTQERGFTTVCSTSGTEPPHPDHHCASVETQGVIAQRWNFNHESISKQRLFLRKGKAPKHDYVSDVLFISDTTDKTDAERVLEDSKTKSNNKHQKAAIGSEEYSGRKAQKRETDNSNVSDISQMQTRLKLKSSIEQRTRTLMSETLLKCQQCGKAFIKAEETTVRNLHPTGDEILRCKECKETLSQSNNVTAPIQNHTTNKPYECNECGKTFTKKAHLTEHIRHHTDDKRYKCNDCGKGFNYSGHLMVHTRSHTDGKPYKCNKCVKAFGSKSYLTVHMQHYIGEKRYKCNVCGKTFRQSGGLTLHLRSHTENKHLKCNVCGKAFTYRERLTAHVRSHEVKKPFKCKECGNAFAVSSDLTNHMRYHENDKPFKCNECGKEFRQSAGLTLHLRSHAGKDRFKCCVCGQVCSNEASFHLHMQRHSSD